MSNLHRNFIAPLLACVALCGAWCVAGEPAVNVTGRWAWLQERTKDEKVAVTLTLVQEGPKVTGTYHGQGPDSAIYDGMVDGNTLQFSVDRKVEGNDVKITYTGKVEGDTVKGEFVAKAGWHHKTEAWEAKKSPAK